MTPNYPIIWYQQINLSGDATVSNFVGPHVLAWIKWPIMGVSFLHSMTRDSDYIKAMKP